MKDAKTKALAGKVGGNGKHGSTRSYREMEEAHYQHRYGKSEKARRKAGEKYHRISAQTGETV